MYILDFVILLLNLLKVLEIFVNAARKRTQCADPELVREVVPDCNASHLQGVRIYRFTAHLLPNYSALMDHRNGIFLNKTVV